MCVHLRMYRVFIHDCVRACLHMYMRVRSISLVHRMHMGGANLCLCPENQKLDPGEEGWHACHAQEEDFHSQIILLALAVVGERKQGQSAAAVSEY